MPEPRYRVLALCSHPVQYMSPLLRHLAGHPQLDLHVVYCSMRGAEPALDPEFGTTVQWDVPLLDGYSWTNIPNRGFGDSRVWGLFNPGLWGFIRRGRFDVVLSYVGYVWSSFWIAYFATRLSPCAFVFGTDASSLAPRDAARWKPLLKKLAWPHLFGLADQVIVPSSAGREMMRSLAIPENHITLTPFVVDNDWWTEQSHLVDRAAIRYLWGLGPQDLAVLFCAKLQPWKRPLDLLRAFAKANVPGTHLIFAGDGPLKEQLQEEARTLGIGQRVRFLGFVNQSQLPATYTAADLFVLPSDYDPCPVVVCESMLCGLPVLLSSEIRGRFDLVQPSVTGDIFTCGDVDGLAALLRTYLADRDRLHHLGQCARERMATWSQREALDAALLAIQSAVQHRRGQRGT